MAVMIVFCARMMRGMSGVGCMASHSGHTTSEIEDLRREVRELKEQIQKLRDVS
jgi:polyhydroxyalkanoate synthesis regulator phasin